jgi:hypothetical protein
MSRLGHSYRKHFGHHGRFHLAVLLTIVVVTYVLVPKIARLLDAASGYSPMYYEPKDFTRQLYMIQHGGHAPVVNPWTVITEVFLVLLVVIVWMVVLPRGGWRRR